MSLVNFSDVSVGAFIISMFFFHGTTACDHQILRQSRAAPRLRPIAYPSESWYFSGISPFQ